MQDRPCLPAGDRVPVRWSMLVPAFVLGPKPSHARLRMEVEDSGGVVLTAYHSYARSQPLSSEPRCAPRAASSHPGSRYRALRREQGFPGLEGFMLQLGFLPVNTTTVT